MNVKWLCHRTLTCPFTILPLLSLTVTLGCSDPNSGGLLNTDKSGEGQQRQSDENSRSAEFIIQVDNPCESPCTISVKSSSDVQKVAYEVDGYLIGKSADAEADFAISYSFSQAGEREIVATAFDREGHIITQTSASTIVKREQAQLSEVPYFYQYDNRLSPSASCQNTSIAMVLQWVGVSVTPDDITARYGKDYAQSPSGLADVFNRYTAEAGLSARLTPITDGTFAGLHAELARGVPVIVHGYFTSYGHVLVTTGYDGQGYYNNDPAGRWNELFQGGYPGRDSSAGRQVYYPARAYEAAVGTSNGYSALPLWYHKLTL